MLGFASRLIGGAVTPLLDQVTTFGASLLRKLALFLVAAVCMVVVIVALTLAFAFWISSLSNPISGALAVAALYLAVAVVAVVLALRGGKPVRAKTEAGANESAAAAQASAAADSDRVDQFTAPLLSILASLGLRREQLAVLAGASLAKRLRPVSLVGVAIVAGFLVGRLWQGWDALFPADLVDAVVDLVTPGRQRQARDGSVGDGAPGRSSE